jgi:hypothetical protein
VFITGLATFLALLFVFVKLPRRTLLRLLHHDMAVDVGVTLLVFVIHFGTFSGLMPEPPAPTVPAVAIRIGISAAQQNTIRRLAGEVGVELPRVLEYFGVTSLADIPVADCLRVVRSLENRRAA